MASKWVKCSKCGKTDISVGPHVGTSTKMKCSDCADSLGKASLCRNCCPTGHGTRPE